MITVRGALMTAIFVISASAAAEAQGATKKPPPGGLKPQVSCGPFGLVLVSIVDRNGATVKDARIEVLRQRDKVPVPAPMSDLSLDGRYNVIDDFSHDMVRPSGEPFVLRITRGKSVMTKVLRIGHSADGCHVRLMGGTDKIVFAP